ncbi:MAG: glycosyltransferase [Anaerolineaceae bacterium]|nr:MAG: glycosyltransferase [Anaerolineaceae bacterium]
MRILVLIHEFPPVGGGGGKAAEDICTALARRGHELTVLTAHLRGLPREETRGGLRVVRLPSLRTLPYKAGLPAMTAFVLAGLWAGFRFIRRWRPDVIHVHFAVPAGAAAWALSRLTKVPYVLTVHLGDVPGGVPEKTGNWFRWLSPFTPPIWRGAKRVAAVSEYTRSLARGRYPVRVEVIPNGVDLKALKPASLAVHTPPAIVFAGRFMPQKDPVGLVEILARVRDLPWTCAMLGDGPLRPQVEAAIAAHGLGERFRLPGWVTPEEVISHFAKSDLLFMPSLSEGLPVVGVQALAMGLAIVANKVGGFVELVEPGRNGFLAEPGDGEAVAAALRSLLSDPAALAQARRISRDLARRFDIEIVADGYEAIFREVTG